MYLTAKEFSIVINLALSSSQLQSLTVPHMKLRPYMHLLIYGAIGIGKSTILYEIGEKMKQVPLKSITSATLMGAVDQNSGEFSTPAIWNSVNSVMLIDEFHITKQDNNARKILNDLLSLMENAEYIKKLGYRCNNFKETKGDLYCKVEKNTIHCKTKFTLIVNTMMDLDRAKMQELHALMSRCMVIPYYLSHDELERFAFGENVYKFKKFKIKNKNVKINAENYKKIVDFVKGKEIPQTRFLRLIGDLCRAYAVLGRIDKEVFEIIVKLAEVMPKPDQIAKEVY